MVSCFFLEAFPAVQLQVVAHWRMSLFQVFDVLERSWSGCKKVFRVILWILLVVESLKSCFYKFLGVFSLVFFS